MLVTDTVRRTARRLIHIVTAFGEIITTPEHPFARAEVGWVHAEDLVPEDLLLGLKLVDGRPTTTAVLSISSEPGPDVPVFNLTVAGTHAYAVGSGLVLVHNGGCHSRQSDGTSPSSSRRHRAYGNAPSPTHLPRFTYRGDRNSPFGPYGVFARGMNPRGGNDDIGDHVVGTSDTGFVSTSKSRDIARSFVSGSGGFIYKLSPRTGVDVDQLFADEPWRNSHRGEEEVAIPGSVDARDIQGAWDLNGNWFPNPNWRPR